MLKRISSPIVCDYVGIHLKKGLFVYGYGMDNKGKERNLRDIYCI